MSSLAWQHTSSRFAQFLALTKPRVVSLIVFCAVAARPFLWHLVSSLKDPAEVTQIPPTLLPTRPTVDNYLGLFGQRPFLTYCINGFLIASLSSVLCGR